MKRLSPSFWHTFHNFSNLFWIPIHRLGTKFSYHCLRIYSSPPETVNLYPTFRCNLKCEMCFERYTRVRYELSPGEWQEIIRGLSNFHPRLHISGGEPFLYPGIIKIIEQIKKEGLFLYITTNGTFLDDYAWELIRLKVDRLDISIDGTEDVHDKIRGVRGTYKQLLKGLERLKRIKKGRHLPFIKINSIINFENPEEMKEIIKLSIAYGVKMVQFIHPLFLDGTSITTHQHFLKKHLGLNLNYWQQANQFRPLSFDFYRIN